MKSRTTSSNASRRLAARSLCGWRPHFERCGRHHPKALVFDSVSQPAMSSPSYNDDLQNDFPASAQEPLRDSSKKKTSYHQILKSTALIGGSSAVNIGMGIIRTKVMATLLGPAGFGLAGLFLSVSGLAQSIAGMGLNNSGVRQIAEAAGDENSERMARTAITLKRVSVILGLLGTLALIVLASYISTITFGTDRHTGAIRFLSLAVFFHLVGAGQGALVQGTRRIADLAKLSITGAVLGTLVTIPIVYFFREEGVVPSIVAVGATSLLTSWWYSRKIKIEESIMTFAQMWQESSALLKLGFVFMVSSLLGMASAYLVRVMLLHQIGIAATGLYQSAWTLGCLYAGFILQAMGADFYPRLTASAHDDAECNRLVNEQARVCLLLSGPGALATLTFAPLVIAIFYSAKFGPAVPLLRWIALGTSLQLISWPLAYIILAKGDQNRFFWAELGWTVVHVGLAWVCIGQFGLNGAGIAFFGSYVFHVAIIYWMARQLSGFRWSLENATTAACFLSLFGLVFVGSSLLPVLPAAAMGGLVLIVTTAYSARALLALVSIEKIPRSARPILAWCGLLPIGTMAVQQAD